MWVFQLFSESPKKKSTYYRRRVLAYSILFFIGIDFIPLIISIFNNFYDNPFFVRDKAIGVLPWLFVILKGFEEGFQPDKSDRGFFYSIWEPFSADYKKTNDNSIKTYNEISNNSHENINILSENKSYNYPSSKRIESNKANPFFKRKITSTDNKQNNSNLNIEENSSQILEKVNSILKESYEKDFSDIHIEPKEDKYKIRARKDGILQSYMNIERNFGKQLVASLKNLADMDVSEKRASQDGKIYKIYSNRKLEFRCSTIPGRNGESMVLRLLKSYSSLLNLDTLIGVSSVRKTFRDLISLQNGIIIVCGPTGSGKTTTLAAALREIDDGRIKIVTAEDPIEYDLGGDIVQAQVNKSKNQTFPYLLRTFMRHDPDVILIGETRDPETANASMDASETGHLVFTTLHANSAASSLTRLLDMDVPKYKLNTSVRAVLAQRLVRCVCKYCSSRREINDEDSHRSGIKSGTLIRYANVLSEEKRNADNISICEYCLGLGYKGRIGVYELMKIDRNIKNAISKGKTDIEIEQLAVEGGMITIREYAKELIVKELTTISELERVCRV